MTSPTKPKSDKVNPDMDMLKELNPELQRNLKTTLDFLPNAQVKKFIDNPSSLSMLLMSRSLVEELEKLMTSAAATKILPSVYRWQTELIFHYNRLINQLKSQPYSVIIIFLQQNFALDLMHPVPLTPRKSARLQARGNGSSPIKEIAPHNEDSELPHHKPVARKLVVDFNTCVKADRGLEQAPPSLKMSPRF